MGVTAILSLLGRLPLWVYLCLGIAAWGGWGHWQVSHLQRTIDNYKLAVAQASAAQQESFRKLEQEKAQAVQDVQNDLFKRLKVARKTASDLSAANTELQRVISTPRTGDTSADIIAICGANGERGRSLERLLGESADLVGEGAARVAELSAKNSALQDYIRKVCLGNKHADN